jgi:hypothetical protein
MIAAAAFALATQLAGIDWPSLPLLPYRLPPQLSPQMHVFAAREARTRHCPLPPADGARQTITVQLAVLIDGEGQVRTVVPRAIDCATVEQYAAGLVAAFARNNLLPRSTGNEQWYKTSLTFAWNR